MTMASLSSSQLVDSKRCEANHNNDDDQLLIEKESDAPTVDSSCYSDNILLSDHDNNDTIIPSSNDYSDLQRSKKLDDLNASTEIDIFKVATTVTDKKITIRPFLIKESNNAEAIEPRNLNNLGSNDNNDNVVYNDRLEETEGNNPVVLLESEQRYESLPQNNNYNKTFNRGTETDITLKQCVYSDERDDVEGYSSNSKTQDENNMFHDIPNIESADHENKCENNDIPDIIVQHESDTTPLSLKDDDDDDDDDDGFVARLSKPIEASNDNYFVSPNDDMVFYNVPITPQGMDPPISTDMVVAAIPDIEEPSKESLQPGDHVYQWRSLAGIPCVFQHHGIVWNAKVIQDENGDTKKQVTIVDFSNLWRKPDKIVASKKRLVTLEQEGILQTYTDTESTWHKVKYQATFWERHTGRAGTCTSAAADAVGMILARVHFLLEHPEVLPNYHVVFANCECVAVWCRTGHWSTVQASSWLEYATAGQIKSASTLAAVASSTQVTVPASGVWGWMGYTTQVSYMAYQPMVIPALAAYGAITVGIPALLWARAQSHWNKTQQEMADAFWGYAMEQPELFAEMLTHFSTNE